MEEIYNVEKNSKCFLKRFGPVISFSGLNSWCSEIVISKSKTNECNYIDIILLVDNGF